MSHNNSTNKTQGLDVGVSTQLLQSQNAHTQATTGAMANMHQQSMSAMKEAMASMQASQAASEAKFSQLAHSMQAGMSNSMMSMASMFNGMMNMMGPALMGGMSSSGMNSMVLGLTR